MNEVIRIVKTKKRFYRFFLMVLSLFISALVFNLFLLPIHLVVGGSNGIATIIQYVYHVDPAFVILVISLICIILSFMYLGVERTMGTVVASLLYPLFVSLTEPIAIRVVLDYSDLFVVVIFAGFLSGIANGLMYKTGYSSGGLPVICQILYQYFKIPIAKSSLVMNLIIVFCGSLFFGTTKAMYAIVLLYINSIMIDKVLLGVSSNKAFYIITKEEQEVKDYIIHILGHSVTIFDVKGGFLKRHKNVLWTIIPSREYYRVTQGIRLLDKDAFFVVTDAYEVQGGK